MKNDSIKFAQLSSNTTMTYKDKVLVNDSITLYKYLIEVTDNDVTSRFNIYLENFVENLDKINKEKFVKKLIEELNEHPGLADIYIGNVSVLEDGTTTFSVNEEVYNSFYDVITSSNDNTNESVTNKNAQTHTQNNQNYHNSNYEDYSIPSEGAIKWDCDALAEATYDFMSGCSIFNESVTSIANQIRVADIPNDINGALLLNSANKILDVLKEKTDYLLAAYVAWGNSIKDFYIEEELQKLDFELTELQNSGALDETKKENIEQRRKLLLEAKNSDKSFVELYYDVKNTMPVELTEEQIKEYYNTEEGTKELYNKYLEAYEDEAMAKSAYILFCEENGIMLTGDMKKIVDERNTLYNKLVSQGVYNETQIAQKMMSFDAKNNLSIEVLNQYKAELEQNKQEYIGSATNKKEEERLLHEWEVLNGMVQDDALLDKLKTSGKLSYSEQLDAQRAALEEAAKEGQSLEEIARNGFITLTTGGILNVGVLALTFTQGLFGFGEGVYDAALTLGASDFIQNTEKWLKGEEVSPFKHTQDVNKMFKDYWSEYYQSEEYKKEFQEWYQKNNESYDPMGEFKLYVENKFKKEYGSSSTIYSKAVEEAIETGDYSNLDNIDLNTLRNAAKQFDTMDKVAISYVNDFAQHYIYDKDWYKEIEQYSLIKHDGILGQVSLQIGRMAIPIALSAFIPGSSVISLGALGTISTASLASSAALGISAFGSAAEGAYTDGATYEQGVKYATLSAATEMLTEKLFSGVAGIGEGWLDNALASRLDKIMYKISPKLSDNLIAQISKNLFVKGVGEGVEEVTSDLLDPIWQWMTYKSDYELGDVYKENVSLESLAQTFLISALTGIFMGGAEIGRNVNRFNTQLDSLNNLNKLFPNVEEYANAALAHMINMEGSTYSKVEVIDEIINTISSKMAEDARNAHPVPDLIDSLSNIKDGSSQIRIGGETITLSNEALYNILDSAKINNNKLEINLDGEVIETDVLGDGSSGIIDISDSVSRVLSPETITEISFSDAKVQSRFMNSLFNSAEASLQQMLANPDIDSLSKEKINSLIEQMHNMKNNGNFSENIHDVANVINNMYNTRMNSVFTTLSDDMVVSNPVRVTDELYKYTAVYKDADGNYKTVTVYSNSNINYDSIFTDPATIESEITRAINANKDGYYVYIGKPTIESTGEVVFNEEIGVREKIEQIESGKDTQIKEDAEIIDVSENSDVVEDTSVNTRENVNATEETGVNTRENVNVTEETNVNTRENVNVTEETGVNTRENVNVTEETGVNARENVNATEETGVNARENVNATEETNTNTTSETLSAASVGAASMSGVMSGARTTTTGSTTTGTTVNTNENVSTDTVGRRINTNEHGTARGSVTETSTVTESSTGTVSGISSYLKQILSEKITIIKSNVHKGYVIRGLSKSFIENRIYDINTISKGLNKIGSKINADTNILTKAGHNMFITTSEFINQFAGRIEVIKDNVFNGKVVSGIAKMITFPYQTTIDGVRHTINFFGRTLGSDMNFDINNNITTAKNIVIENIKGKVDSIISEVTDAGTVAEADVSKETVDSSLGESIVESGAAVVEEVMSEKITPPSPTLDSSKNVDVNPQENVVKGSMKDYFAPDLSDNTVKQTEQKVSQEYKMDDLYDTPTLESQKEVDVSYNVANNQVVDSNNNITSNAKKGFAPQTSAELETPNVGVDSKSKLLEEIRLRHADELQLELQKAKERLANPVISSSSILTSENTISFENCVEENISDRTLQKVAQDLALNKGKTNQLKDLFFTNNEYDSETLVAPQFNNKAELHILRAMESGQGYTKFDIGEGFSISKDSPKLPPGMPNKRMRAYINPSNPEIHYKTLDMIMERCIDQGLDIRMKPTGSYITGNLDVDKAVVYFNDPKVIKIIDEVTNEIISKNPNAYGTPCLCGLTSKNGSFSFGRADVYTISTLRQYVSSIERQAYYNTIAASSSDIQMQVIEKIQQSHFISKTKATSIVNEILNFDAFKNNMKLFVSHSVVINGVRTGEFNEIVQEIINKQNIDGSKINIDDFRKNILTLNSVLEFGDKSHLINPAISKGMYEAGFIDKYSIGNSIDGEITPPPPTLDSSKNVDVNLQENVVKSGMEDYFAPDLSDNVVKQAEQKVSQDYKMEDLFDTPTLEPQKKVDVSDNVTSNANAAGVKTNELNWLEEYFAQEKSLASDANTLKNMLSEEAISGGNSYLKTVDEIIQKMIDAQESGLDLNTTQEVQALIDATKKLKPGEVILNRAGVLDGETPVVISNKIASKYGEIVTQVQVGLDSGTFTKTDAQKMLELLKEKGVKTTESITELKTKLEESAFETIMKEIESGEIAPPTPTGKLKGSLVEKIKSKFGKPNTDATTSDFISQPFSEVGSVASMGYSLNDLYSEPSMDGTSTSTDIASNIGKDYVSITPNVGEQGILKFCRDKYKTKIVEELGKYYGDAGYDIHKMFESGKTATQILSELNGKKKLDFENFLQNTISGRYLSTLSEQEILALCKYTDGSSVFVNSMLRAKKINGEIDGIDAHKFIEYMDSAIERYGGLECTTQLFRGISVGSFIKPFMKKYGALFNFDMSNLDEVYASIKTLEGKEFGDLGYMSTSPGYDTSFAKLSHYPVVLDITAPTGTKGAYINQISGFYNLENELLLARDTTLRITEILPPAVDTNGNDKIVVKCVII